MEPGGTQTHISHIPRWEPYPLDHLVHSFPVTALDTGEPNSILYTMDIFVEGTPLCDVMGSPRCYY